MAHDQENELVLMSGEHCFCLDKTNGTLKVAVGPYVLSLTQTNQLVEWSSEEKKMVPVGYNDAKRNNIVIPEGWYAPLKNPGGTREHPVDGAMSDQSGAGLLVGKKVNISGPSSFALWPGQMAKVIEGHKLRSNQYLLVRVYDVEAFKNELSSVDKIVVHENMNEGDDDKVVSADENVAARSTDIYGGLVSDKLATGQQFIIRGTDVHFYIPPNGVEVIGVQECGGIRYVQDAVTLQRLEYCILQAEKGDKRYVRGPNVVFPEPTEKFLTYSGNDGKSANKFRAIELNETSGLYIKVIKAYEENDLRYKEGDELFITGKEQKIYFPREEHAVVKYGDQDRHFALALPEGEGRYVLDRLEGKVSVEMGPQMLLPDPRKDVIINRRLTEKEVKLFYPGRDDILAYNVSLEGQSDSDGYVKSSSLRRRGLGNLSSEVTSDKVRGISFASSYSSGNMFEDMMRDDAKVGVMGDTFDRQGQFVKPRSITLDSKFDGVVSLDIWNGYAVMVKDKSGNRRVVVGPSRVHLEYDETLEPFKLSTGTPKRHGSVIEDVYLRVKNNTVSDVIKVETKDLCDARIHLTMHVDFTGDTDEDRLKWFSVENYVKILCERVASLLKNKVKLMSVMDFYNTSTDAIRDIVLGKNEDGIRKGLVFEEIGLCVNDVDVLSVQLSDGSLSEKLKASAFDALNNALEIEKRRRELEHETEQARIAETVMGVRNNLELQKLAYAEQLGLESLASKQKQEDMKREVVLSEIAKDVERWKADLEQAKAKSAFELNKKAAFDDLQKGLMVAEAQKIKDIMGAVQPKLVEALTAIGDNEKISKLAQAVAPQSMFEPDGILDLMKAKYGGLGLDALLERLGMAINTPEKKTTAKK